MSHGKNLNLITKDFFKLTLGQIWSLKKYLFGNLFSWESVKPWWHFQTKAYTREHIWENNKNTQIYRCCQENFPSQIFYLTISQISIYNIINTEYQMYLPLQILLHKLTNINLQYHKYRISRELTFTNITPPPGVNSACCNSSWAKRKRKSKMIWCLLFNPLMI